MGSALANLPEHYAKFIEAYSRTGDILEASKRSGVPESTCYYILKHPSTQAAIHAEVRRLLNQAAPKALATLIHLVENAVSERVKADCAKAIIDRAGFVAPRALPAASGSQQTLTEMSIDELKDLAGKLEHELSERATVVSAPPSQAAPVQPIDLLE